ncbi:MAG TPA: hypothetical protein DCE42_27225 [Myxococcales bacterium]|nr:hypothetical protein [Deltaproteobacteria bacterium]MBU49916.1 hypothetical protein [Deltaproteobacteria bacterium]HAA58485.1 hypothetical protein [Myxococcales bacterium]|tara:strand:- start:2021 stop:2317 length:297 start_codon:yes stop_codon:yes gene_type:complete
MSQQLGACPVCFREMIEGRSVNKHHLIPKTFGGREVIWIHTVCHSKIHATFTERELLHTYHTPERIREHEQMRKFIKWVQKKDPEFTTRHRTSRRKKR